MVLCNVAKRKRKSSRNQKTANEVQKRTNQYARTIEIVTYCQHRYGQLSYKIALALALFFLEHFHEKQNSTWTCYVRVFALYACQHQYAYQPSLQTKKNDRFTQTKHDPIFYCCSFLFLFFFILSHSQRTVLCSVFCALIFLKTENTHRDINFDCQIEIFVGYIFIMCSAIFMTLFGVDTQHNKPK